MILKKVQNLVCKPEPVREHITGYCLGSGFGSTRKVGEKWWNIDSPVWVLPTMRAARKIEANSDAWREICKVEGYAHVIERMPGKHGKIWVSEPTRLNITEVHPQYVPQIPYWAEKRRLLKNVKQLLKSELFADRKVPAR